MSHTEDHLYHVARAIAADRMAMAASHPAIAAIHSRMAREYSARAHCAEAQPVMQVRQTP